MLETDNHSRRFALHRASSLTVCSTSTTQVNVSRELVFQAPVRHAQQDRDLALVTWQFTVSQEPQMLPPVQRD